VGGFDWSKHPLKSKWNFLVAFVLAIVLLSVFPSPALVPNARAQAQASRQVTIPVKVVFVGIDPGTVDLNYIQWPGNLPTTTFGGAFYPMPVGSLSGVVYNVSYTFTYASNDFKSKLETYLQSIHVAKFEPNPWFYYPVADASGHVNVTNFYSLQAVTYDANKVENWLYSNQQDVGGFPSNGWTLMFMYLPELPSYDFKDYRDFLLQRSVYHQNAPPNGTAHYYSVAYGDSDLGYQVRFRDYMTGWGNVHRFWFDDLSAGPSFWTSSEDIPLQIALADNHIDLGTAYGKIWLTQFIADYVTQATWNFVTPFFVYPPTYSQNYSIDVHIFDNRTVQEKQAVDIHSTINPDKIKSAFQDLLPYSSIDVSVKFEELSNYAGLESVIRSSYKYTDSFTLGALGDPNYGGPYGIVDARPVYKYLSDNIQVFEPNYRRDTSEFTIPVFAFAFSNDTLFTFTYKWIVAKPDSEIKALLGVALGDLVMISLSQKEFQRGNYVTPVQPGKGEGFTEVVIHESGHMVGLQHPHNFGPVGDFIISVMGYYTYDYVFGQIDKDSLRRVHVDQIYLEVESMLAGISGSQASSIKSQLSDTDAKYSQMDYVGALASVLKAEDMAKAATSTGSLAAAPVLYLVVGLLIGFVVAWVVLRRRTGTPFRVDRTPIQTTAFRFCPNCGSATYPNNIYCHECGTRLPK
jgi:hypothetical protein